MRQREINVRASARVRAAMISLMVCESVVNVREVDWPVAWNRTRTFADHHRFR
ncbi:hypothetical protein [Streptomyces sp. SM11]|uniref:hypothetical protein n=1 Tax=Streptomyces sp. SM11 TaxID=565557 RepID=UPI0015E16AA1|nr:hypothetical protein [Streptomyces sp. SM11]